MAEVCIEFEGNSVSEFKRFLKEIGKTSIKIGSEEPSKFTKRSGEKFKRTTMNSTVFCGEVADWEKMLNYLIRDSNSKSYVSNSLKSKLLDLGMTVQVKKGYYDGTLEVVNFVE